MAAEAEILSELAAAEGIAADWDRLAVAAGRAYSAPAWGLAWWRHAAPEGGALRVVAVRDGGELIGVAPLWATGNEAAVSRYEFLAARLSAPTGPLSAAGREREVATALTAGLAEAEPRPRELALEGNESEGWTGLLRESWPDRGAWSFVRLSRPLPTILVDGLAYEAWLGRKSAKFRQRARRGRRRLEEQGGLFHAVARSDFAEGLDIFERLHAARWQERGGSDALIPGIRPMMEELAGTWLDAGRLRIFTLEVEGEPAAAWFLVAAGGAVDAWNTGFDDRFSRLSPAFQLMLHVIEDAGERGEETICLGGGGAEYKLRLADRVDTLSRDLLVPRNARYPLARLRLAPAQARRAAAERLSDQAKARIRSFGRRGRS